MFYSTLQNAVEMYGSDTNPVDFNCDLIRSDLPSPVVAQVWVARGIEVWPGQAWHTRVMHLELILLTTEHKHTNAHYINIVK